MIRVGIQVAPCRAWRLGLWLLLLTGADPRAGTVLAQVASPPSLTDRVSALVSATNRPGSKTYVLWSKEGKQAVFWWPQGEDKEAAAPIPPNQTLLAGDTVETKRYSQALLLSPQQAAGVDESSELEVTASHLDLHSGGLYVKTLPPESKGTWATTTGGELSSTNAAPRAPRVADRLPPHPELWVRTPAGVVRSLGTEFFIKVDPATRITEVSVGAGAVELSNANGAPVRVDPNQVGILQANTAPYLTNGVQTFNQKIQWILYYPAILDLQDLRDVPGGAELAADANLQASLDAYRHGDVAQAFERYPTDRKPASGADRVYRAAVLLAAGRVDEIQELLGPLVPPASADREVSPPQRLALAFQRVILAVRGEAAAARTKATSATEWMAESYYLQSQSDLDGALAAARSAIALDPTFQYGRTRVAELEFSFGRTQQAKAALNAVLASGFTNAPAVALQGFLEAADDHQPAAIRAFETATVLDPRLGNAWLGLGLCSIREGRVAEGLKCLQIAVLREPQRAILRSYLGKGYDVAADRRRARRDLGITAAEGSKRAAEELTRSTQLDPGDPTPYLYRALTERRENRINAAVRDLELSKELNDNRSVYRSRLMLDQDQAVRGANLAAIYRDADMEEVSVREASRAVGFDYGNYSAHLFLANSYDALRDPGQVTLRFETPWLNELLLANLLQPVGAGSLSQTVSQQEYSRLFEQDHLGFFSQTRYLSSGDWLESASQYGTVGRTAYSVDVFYHSLRGQQRPNENLQNLSLWAKIKQQLTPNDSVYLEAIFAQETGGDLRQMYSPTNALVNFHYEETQDPILLAGYHHRWSPEHQTLFLGSWLNDTYTAGDGRSPANLQTILFRGSHGELLSQPKPVQFRRDVAYESDLQIFSGELEHIWQTERFTTIAGVRYQNGTFETDSLEQNAKGIPSFPPVVFHKVLADQAVTSSFDRFSAYGYETWQPLTNAWLQMLLTGGLAYDRIHYPVNHRSSPISAEEDTKDQVSPKAGLIFTCRTNTVLRASYTRSLGGVSFDQSFRLEPSQVAGFVQSYRSLVPESVVGSVPAPEFQTWGVALEHRFPTETYVGVTGEWLESTADQVTGLFNSSFGKPLAPGQQRAALSFRERTLRVTANQLLGELWSVGLRYRLSQAELQQSSDIAWFAPSDTEALLNELEGNVLLNLPCGFFTEFEAIWRLQSTGGYSPERADDSFVQLNWYAGYRFWKRRAEVRLGVLNLTDQDYQLTPLNFYSELPRERLFFASLKLSF